MKNSKKILSGITAFAFMLALASCSSNADNSSTSGDNSGGGNSNGSSQGDNTQLSASQGISHAYKAVELESAVPMNYIERVMPMGEDKLIIIGNDTDNNNVMYYTDYEFINFTKINFTPEQPENGSCYYNTRVGSDGTIYIFMNTTTYGDVEMPAWDDPDFDSENFDWDAFYEAAENSYKLCTIDIEGNILTENEVTGLDKYMGDEDEIYLGDIFICGNRLLVTISGMGENCVVEIGADGVIGDEIDFSGNEDDVYNLYTNANDKDGNLYYTSWGESGQVMKKIDAETLEISEVLSIGDSNISYVSSFITATGDYSFYVSDSSAMYGIKSDGSTEEVVNWLDSDLNGDYINYFFPLENGEFVIYERNWNSNSSGFYRLVERDASELENVKVLTMVVPYSNTSTMEKVNEFNKKDNGYRIKIVDYNGYYEYDEESGKQINTPENQLKMDIAAGKSYDIIAMSGSSALINTLGKKGALADLYELMGTNGTITKDDILPVILQAGEYDGKLYNLSPSFYISSQAVKKKYCDKENWTVSDMIDTYESVSDKMRLYRYAQGKSSILNQMAATGGFVDFTNAKCYFDSDDFKVLLEFCNGIEETETPNWESASQEEMDAYWNEQEVACRNDKALIESFSIYSLRDYSRLKYATFNDDICLVGMPSNDGNGALLQSDTNYSIMANSENKEVAWEFISQFFDEDYQTNGNSIYAIPALKSAFEQRLDETMGKPYYIDENGKKQEYEDSYYIAGESITIPPLSQAERDELEKYILSAKPYVTDYYDSGIYDIVSEEAEAYFNGERSAQETADIIQNRVSILVSEQY